MRVTVVLTVVLNPLIALKPQNVKLTDLRLLQGFGGELLP